MDLEAALIPWFQTSSGMSTTWPDPAAVQAMSPLSWRCWKTSSVVISLVVGAWGAASASVEKNAEAATIVAVETK